MGPKIKNLISIVFLFIVLALGGYIIFQKNIGTVNVPDSVSIPVTSNDNKKVPYLSPSAGLEISLYAKGVPSARVIAFDKRGRMLVSQTAEGKISIIENGSVKTLISGLNNPHGLAFRCSGIESDECNLYVAESDALLRYSYDEKNAAVSGKTKLLPIEHSIGDRHFTRTLLFLSPPKDNILLISVGSSCNVCRESGSMRGKILAYDINTGEVNDYAKGLRNAVFMTENPANKIVFLTEMGRDNLGDNIPPDEVNMFDPSRAEKAGAPNFGWPNCYGKNIHDTVFDKNTYIRNPCMEPFETPSWLDIPAHSAPLGLAFLPDSDNWGDYRNNLIIAFHGSWNRSVPDGYKIARTVVDAQGNPGKLEDFVTGWLTPEGTKLGRPADVKVSPDGASIYVSDDLAGVIYKISPI